MQILSFNICLESRANETRLCGSKFGEYMANLFTKEHLDTLQKYALTNWNPGGEIPEAFYYILLRKNQQMKLSPLKGIQLGL